MYEPIACRTDVTIKHTSDMGFIAFDKRVSSAINAYLLSRARPRGFYICVRRRRRRNRYDRKNNIIIYETLDDMQYKEYNIILYTFEIQCYILCRLLFGDIRISKPRWREEFTEKLRYLHYNSGGYCVSISDIFWQKRDVKTNYKVNVVVRLRNWMKEKNRTPNTMKRLL